MAISRMQNPKQLQGIGSLRQPYGLGKLVKKAVRGVKKIVKSPIGKAAILAGLGMYGMGAGPWASGGMWGKAKGAGFLRNMMAARNLGVDKLDPFHAKRSGGLRNFASKWLNPFNTKNPLLYNKLGKFSGKKAFGLGATAMVGMPFLQKAMKWGPYQDVVEEEEDWTDTPGTILNLRNQARDYYRAATPDYIGSPFMPDKQYVLPNFYAADGGRAGLLNGGGAGEAQIEQMLRAEYLKYKNKGGTMPYEQFKILVMKQAQQGQTPNQMMADGGRMGFQMGGDDDDELTYNPYQAMDMYKRTRRQEGGMIDMGGQEKDYRDEGGFVALGGEERADDVPARLSKNEFVFTADAVRAAGGGDIDKGSEVMQNVMDNLEQGGEVSEDSQGLQGGEEIMSEEIIDESNPAQGMYDNYEQLQSRVA